jgi:hypothetical protein
MTLSIDSKDSKAFDRFHDGFCNLSLTPAHVITKKSALAPEENSSEPCAKIPTPMVIQGHRLAPRLS